MNGDNRYKTLYQRNWPIIPNEIQGQIKNLKIAIAGCGSTGGAIVDGALRLGVEQFHLCDNGTYELNNLNRQMVFANEIDRNKAEVQSERIKKVNSEAKTQFWAEGLTKSNVDQFLSGVDFLFDAVDVTTKHGMEMKLLLHEKAADHQIPTGSALDLAFTQWFESYNYHLGVKPLHGKLPKARMEAHPLKALIAGFSPIEDLPYEITEEVTRLIRQPEESACQLACVCFLLSAMITPYLIYFLTKGKLPPLIKINLMDYFETEDERKNRQSRTAESHQNLAALLKETA